LDPNEILHKTIKLKKDTVLDLGAFIVLASIIKAKQAGLKVKNDRECMLVHANGKFIVGIPKTISPNPEIFYNDLPMLEKIDLS